MLTPDMSTKDRNTQDLFGPISGNILSFDFGEKRIGVAIGNNITKTSHPLSTIDTPVNTKRFLAIEKLISQWSPILIVIGFPLNEDGTSSRLTALVKKFLNALSLSSMPLQSNQAKYVASIGITLIIFEYFFSKSSSMLKFFFKCIFKSSNQGFPFL